MSEVQGVGNQPLNLEAIEGADHMLSPPANAYDSDGWYRHAIRELIAEVRKCRSAGLEATPHALKPQYVDLRDAPSDEWIKEATGGRPLPSEAWVLGYNKAMADVFGDIWECCG